MSSESDSVESTFEKLRHAEEKLEHKRMKVQQIEEELKKLEDQRRQGEIQQHEREKLEIQQKITEIDQKINEVTAQQANDPTNQQTTMDTFDSEPSKPRIVFDESKCLIEESRRLQQMLSGRKPPPAKGFGRWKYGIV